MICDAQCLLSDAQAFSADAASTNAYDCGAASRDFTEGEPLGIGISVDVAADSTTGDETYEFQAIQSAADTLGTPDILNARTITAANLTLGSRHIIPIPPGSQTKRYLGLYFNGGGTTPTITLTAFVAPLSALGGWKAAAKGVTVQS